MDAALIVIAALAVVVALAALGMVARQRREPALGADDAALLLNALRGDLADLQQQALEQNAARFMDLAESRLKTETGRGEEQLKARKEEIDKSLLQVSTAIKEMTTFVQRIDKTRSDSILELATVVKESRATIDALSSATGELSQALSSGQARGQWGERMADDILRVAGFIEGVNYRHNRQIEGGSTRPDFTFLLPQERVLHMDVKFPLAGYLRFLSAENDTERDAALKQFLSDVRQRVKEVTTRDYIDPANGTLDYVLVFIPNEQVYGFIHQNDAAILDDALRQRVVLCSPLTLFAVLAVIRQSVDNFLLTERTNEILGALGSFNSQWQKFQEAMDTVGKRIEATQSAYDNLRGRRTRTLDRQVRRVEALRVEAGIDPADIEDRDPIPAELAATSLDDD